MNPKNPVPTAGGNNLNRWDVTIGPTGQKVEVESHPDVLIYTSDVLNEDLSIAGEVQARLYVASDSEDTDVAVRLTDVYPSGLSMLVIDSIQRLSHRESDAEEKPLKPGEVYQATVTTYPTAQTFLKGHQVRIIVSASNYPRYDLNNGSLDRKAPPKVITNQLYHDKEHPSALILPVMPN
jgi:putative CocE/NonD family hydrolase